MKFKKESYYPVVAKAKDMVPGFREAFSRFEERVVLDRCSKSLITNYGRNVAHLALHFGRLPHEVKIVEERCTPITQLTCLCFRIFRKHGLLP